MPDTVIVFLEDTTDHGFVVDTQTLMPDPGLTQITSQSGLYHISTNLEIQRVAELLYQSNCAAEVKALKNWQTLLSTAREGMSLKPYFSQGFTAVAAGGAVHIIKCTPLEATPEFDKKGCFSELPVRLKDENGTYINRTFWAHPVSKILMPVETILPCNPKLPQVYHLEGAKEYYCSFGHGLTPCPAPLKLAPASANLHNQFANDIAVPMGAGVVSQTKHREMLFRVFYHQYQQHLEMENLIRNKERGRVSKGYPIQNIPSTDELLEFEWSIAGAIAPFYTLFGDAYVWIIGCIMFFTVVGAATGLIARIATEFMANGISLRIFYALFQGLYHVATVPIEFLKAGYQGTVRQTSIAVDIAVQPLKDQIARLEQQLCDLRQEPHPTAPPVETSKDSTGHSGPPPSYTSGRRGPNGGNFNHGRGPNGGNFGGGGGSFGGARKRQAFTPLWSLHEKTPPLITGISNGEETTSLLDDAVQAGLASKPNQPAASGADIPMSNLRRRGTTGSLDGLRRPTDAPPGPPSTASAAAETAPGPYNDVAASVSSERHQQAQSDSVTFMRNTANWVNHAAGYAAGKPAQAVAGIVTDLVQTIGAPLVDAAVNTASRTDKVVQPAKPAVKGVSTTSDDSPSPAETGTIARTTRNGGNTSSKK